MRIRLLAFASAADALGAGELELEVPDDGTVADLEGLLIARHPRLASLWPRLAVAVGEELASTDTRLSEGIEVALLPPVSGGGGEDDASRALLVEGPIDLAALIRRVCDPSCGAILVFLGTVRDRHAGRAVSAITYHAYHGMAQRRLRRLVAGLEAEGDGRRVGIAHRLGLIPAGEISVAIAVAAPHRADAYAASREALERLKREVPIWKRERYQDGGVAWREEEALARS